MGVRAEMHAWPRTGSERISPPSVGKRSNRTVPSSEKRAGFPFVRLFRRSFLCPFADVVDHLYSCNNGNGDERHLFNSINPAQLTRSTGCAFVRIRFRHLPIVVALL